MEYIVGDIDNYGSQEDCLTLIIPVGVYELIMEDLRNKFNTQVPFLSITLKVSTKDQLNKLL